MLERAMSVARRIVSRDRLRGRVLKLFRPVKRRECKIRNTPVSRMQQRAFRIFRQTRAARSLAQTILVLRRIYASSRPIVEALRAEITGENRKLVSGHRDAPRLGDVTGPRVCRLTRYFSRTKGEGRNETGRDGTSTCSKFFWGIFEDFHPVSRDSDKSLRCSLALCAVRYLSISV